MTTVAAIGERAALQGFLLAGVRVLTAENTGDVIDAWDALSPQTGIVILTIKARAALGTRTASLPAPLTVVLPS
ncbi:V-type ATP synthase subunit F [Cryobacterium sp. MLB-32]|uniref:V-type ATP synthase subunit F n=1 Tax=Cryobacterium sp. MLB-32 TaxID=1529318 RepID=UPI0018CE162B|nr:V-type ATP synthase subunit F [Cryobacterium sp. MLB-32]